MAAEDVTSCTCVDQCKDYPFGDGCLWCLNMDPYDPCPVVGFGCGAAPPGADACECCTAEQWRAAADGAAL